MPLKMHREAYGMYFTPARVGDWVLQTGHIYLSAGVYFNSLISRRLKRTLQSDEETRS